MILDLISDTGFIALVRQRFKQAARHLNIALDIPAEVDRTQIVVCGVAGVLSPVKLRIVDRRKAADLILKPRRQVQSIRINPVRENDVERSGDVFRIEIVISLPRL